MGNYEVLEHTADLGIKATGASLSDLFETVALAMFSTEYNRSTVPFEREFQLEVSADDLEALLVAWLSELIFLHDSHSFAVGDVIVVEIGEPPQRRAGAPKLIARGVARGRQIGDWFEQTGAQIKAATYHGLEISERKGRWQATVYLDV